MNPVPTASDYRTLPLELEHQIIGQLDSLSDLEALRTCALVHTSWRTRAQSLLFEEVDLRYTHGPLFAKLLDDSPHIGPYVKILTVREGNGRKDYEPKFADEILPRIAPALDNLHTLSIEQAATNLSPSTRAALGACLGRSLRTLKLVHFLTDTMHDFIKFIIGFPLLENLELNGTACLDGDDSGPVTLAMPPSFNIKHLYVKWMGSYEDIFRWFIDVDNDRQLSVRSFEVELTPENGAVVGQFLRRVGPVLEEYTTSMRHIPMNSDIAAMVKEVSISSNTSLRKLILDSIIIYGGDASFTRSGWVPMLLEEATSPLLIDLEFRVWYRDTSDLRALKLPLLDGLLTSPKFPSLRRVVFTLYGSDHTDDGIAEIKTEMPGLAGKGALVFL
ncbi:hypothetical protein PLICRDRAFT_205819 [Plicaturopsis crispa FD-325 SS-3]|nr:hypothetical protein PLICRDRAFT_205819 [Plicaturopsis crispa FD-325 SS-3]